MRDLKGDLKFIEATKNILRNSEDSIILIAEEALQRAIVAEARIEKIEEEKAQVIEALQHWYNDANEKVKYIKQLKEKLELYQCSDKAFHDCDD